MKGEHIVDGRWQSDKYDWCPLDFVALKVTDPDAQPVLWDYAVSHKKKDPCFSQDLQVVLKENGCMERLEERDLAIASSVGFHFRRESGADAQEEADVISIVMMVLRNARWGRP